MSKNTFTFHIDKWDREWRDTGITIAFKGETLKDCATDEEIVKQLRKNNLISADEKTDAFLIYDEILRDIFLRRRDTSLKTPFIRLRLVNVKYGRTRRN